MKKNALLFLLLLGFLSAAGQNRDVQSWTGAQLNFVKIKKTTLSASMQLRLDNNLSSLRQLWGELEAGRKIKKWLTISLGARYVYRTDINSIRFFSDWTFSQDLNLKKIGIKKLDLGLSARIRFQNVVDNLPPSSFAIRPKVKAKLLHKDWFFTPWAAWEEYYILRFGSFRDARMRLTAGVDFNLPRDFTLVAFYTYQQDKNRENPLQTNIFSIGVEYEWD